ncbi:MAG: tetratricopeptide repeat protein [Candidatus Cloacimonetes bacterium]|nr:tetratricopeptide repeat protein [Candidatus Cloacimonadota bacterium]
MNRILASGLLLSSLIWPTQRLDSSPVLSRQSALTSQQNKNAGFELAEFYLLESRYDQAVQTLRQILLEPGNESEEQKATFLLGKALLYGDQPELARTAFEHLNQHWPQNSYKAESEFLLIEHELKGMTNALHFANGLKVILSFSPFSLDLDFFRYFGGYARGYNLKLYTPVAQKLKSWFVSEQKDLRIKALLVDGLVRVIDLGDTSGQINLETVVQEGDIEERHLASAALFLLKARSSIHEIAAMQAVLPADWQKTRTGQLTQFLWIQILAWVHGEFHKSQQIVSELQKIADPETRSAIKPHAELLDSITATGKSAEQRLKLALTLKDYGSYYFAQEQLKLLIQELRPGPVQARAHYEISRILQDDIGDFETAEQHLKLAQTMPLPKEIREELEWRRIKSLSVREQAAQMERLAGLDLPYTEAAIYRQLKAKTLNPRLINKYYQTLDRVELDPASRKDLLIQLAEVSEEAHQYPRARFYLEMLARLDLGEAQKRLEKNLLMQKLHEARLQQTLSIEPEKQQYLQGKYLYLLGKSDEAKKILETILSQKSIFSEKARFEIFTQEAGPLPYQATQLQTLLEWAQQNPDEEVRWQSFLLWLRHLHFVTKDMQNLEEQKQEELKTGILKTSNEVIARALRQNSGITARIEQAAPYLIEYMIHTGDIKSAWDFLEKSLPNKDSVESLTLRLTLETADKKLEEASRTAILLSRRNPEKRDYWLEKAVSLKLQNIQDDPKYVDRYLSTMENFAKTHGDEFFAILQASLFQLGKKFADREEVLSLVLKYQKPLIEAGRVEFKALLDELLRINAKEKSHPELVNIKIALLARIGIASDENWLYQVIQNSSGLTRLNALLALSSMYKNLNRNLKDSSRADWLRGFFEEQLKKPEFEARNPGYLDYLILEWDFLSEDSKKIKMEKTPGSDLDQIFILSRKAILMLETQNWPKASEFISSLLKNANTPAVLAFEVLAQAWNHLNPHREKKMGEFKTWIFRIKPEELPLAKKDEFQNILRRVNAESVITALRKDIDWDDPQKPANIRIFFQIGDLFLKDLKDIPSAIHVFNQMKEYFSDPQTRAEVKIREKDLVLLDEVYRLMATGNLVDSIRGSEILLLQLQRPEEALQGLEKALSLAKSEAERDVVHMQRARVYLQMRNPVLAEKAMQNLSRGYENISASLLQQIEATRLLASLPPRSRSNEQELLQHARIHLLTWFDIREAERVYELLNQKFPTPVGNLSDARALLCLDFYNSLMGVNEPAQAMRWLNQSISLARSVEVQAQLSYMAGYHAYTYDLNRLLAYSSFEKAYQVAPASEWAQLSLLHLIDLCEQDKNRDRALLLLEELKKTFKHERNLREIRPREEELRKSILLARLDEFLEKLGPEDKGMILKSARSLGNNSDFIKEAESKYLLYLRLEKDRTIASQIRMELGNFYLRTNQLQNALKAYRQVYSEAAAHETRLEAALLAIQILGDKMDNFNGAIQLGREARKLMVPPSEIKKIDAEIHRYKGLMAKQKPVTLKTLGYGHLGPIQDIKQSFYRKRDYAGAAQAYEKLLRQTENFQLQVGIHYELARLYDLRIKDYEKAYLNYKAFFSLVENPEVSSEVLLRIAELEFTEFKKYRDALKSYRLFAEKYPSSRKYVSVLFQVAEILVARELDYSGALDVYTDIANAYPQTDYEQKALLARAKVQSDRLSDFNGAIATYQSIINNYFDSDFATQSQFQIGRLYEVQLNDEFQAIAAYQEVINRWPNSSLATDARRQIDKIRRR